MNKVVKLAVIAGTSFCAALAGSLLGEHMRRVMGYEPEDWADGSPCVAKKKECVFGMSECPMAKTYGDKGVGQAHHMPGSGFGETEADIRWMFCPFGRTEGCDMLKCAVPGQTCTHAWAEDCVSGQEALSRGRPCSCQHGCGCDGDHASEEQEAEEPTFCPYGWLSGCDMIDRHGQYSAETCEEAGYECCPAFQKEQSDESAESEKSDTKPFCPFGEVGCFSPDDFEDGVETCPCADDGCVRKHTITDPGHDAFGGSYGGHGRHAEEVAFGQGDHDEDDHEDEEPNV